MRPAYPDQVLDRLNRTRLSRDSVMLGLRPLPPKPASLMGGVLTWEEPKQTDNITHYKVYLRAGTLFAKVPVGQTQLVGFTEDKAFLTSFDDRSLSESYELAISGTATSGGGGGTSGTIDFALTSGTTTTIVLPTPTPSGTLYVFVKADGPTAALAWGASAKWAPTELDSTANTWTVFTFIGRRDPLDSIIKWFYVGPASVTGEPS